MDLSAPLHIVVMGVSGSGKTSVAQHLHDSTGFPYAEADDFHPRSNIQKMESGIPLTDDDRWPWLRALRDWMSEHGDAGESTVVTCSALKRAYRDLLSEAHGNVLFVHLDGPMELIASRMELRSGHFMPRSLLPSQFDTLETLEGDENGITLDISQTIEELDKQVLAIAQRSADAGGHE